MNDNIASLRDRAADAVADTRERVREIAIMRVETSVARSVLGSVVLVVGLAAAGWLWTWHVERQRDQHWRDKIAAASPRVRGAVLAGAAEAEAQDRIIIQAIQGTDHALTDAESDLRKAGASPIDDGCPRIPARCLGLGAGLGGVR